jgi:hypothetical protein
MKLTNTQEENKKLNEKVLYLQEILRKAGKL